MKYSPTHCFFWCHLTTVDIIAPSKMGWWVTCPRTLSMNNRDVSVTEPWQEELIAHPSLGSFCTALPNLEGVRIPCPSQMYLFALGCHPLGHYTPHFIFSVFCQVVAMMVVVRDSHLLSSLSLRVESRHTVWATLAASLLHCVGQRHRWVPLNTLHI